jgi:ubiquinone/menaquinone biosynthesis C-methylase UbiE
MFRPNSVAGDLDDFTPPAAARTSRAKDKFAPESRTAKDSARIPGYLQKYYWWAYVHRNAVRVFERQWLVNAILFGNYAQLRKSALDALGVSLPGRTVQIACAYGDMTNNLVSKVQASGGTLDVIDVLPSQLENLLKKMPEGAPVEAFLMDSAALNIPDASYDRAILFFLLHEQPVAWREKTLSEALRVVKPGGRIVIVDYAGPYRWNPIRYLLAPFLKVLEPFALDLWRDGIAKWMPADWAPKHLERKAFFGGLYQRVSFDR